jgi:hypothetical protein
MVCVKLTGLPQLSVAVHLRVMVLSQEEPFEVSV